MSGFLRLLRSLRVLPAVASNEAAVVLAKTTSVPAEASPPLGPAPNDPSDEVDFITTAIRNRVPVILIHGRAGTGKTTLIRKIVAAGKLRHVIVAPTGVAALNAGGQTIHSFFAIPPCIVNLEDIEPSWKLREMVNRLDVIIIDEISMVRADLLDVMERKLQVSTGRSLPFGGVPVLMVGDFLQLPPVVEREDKEVLLHKGYEVFYAFGAKSLQRITPMIVELSKVHRQNEEHFIDLLSKVRLGEGINDVVTELNSWCHGPHKSANKPIILASRKEAADGYNRAGLALLPGSSVFYKASVEGDFKPDKYPAPEQLELKKDARVMMVKNDPEKRWVNGSLGTVVRLTSDGIWVRIDDAQGDCQVQRVTWEALKYEPSEVPGKVKQRVIGKFSQFPIRHAWAITIHKSQGLTLKDVRVDLGSGAFTHGQTYVALSRATTIGGLSFTSPLRAGDIRVDRDLVDGVRNFK